MANITLTKILNGLDSQSGSLGIAEQIKMSKDAESQTLVDKLDAIDESIAELEASSITTSNIGTWVSEHVDDSTIEFSESKIKVKDEGITEGKLSQEVQNKLNSGGKTYTGESGVTVSGTVISLTDGGVTNQKILDNSIAKEKLSDEVKDDLLNFYSAETLILPTDSNGEFFKDSSGRIGFNFSNWIDDNTDISQQWGRLAAYCETILANGWAKVSFIARTGVGDEMVVTNAYYHSSSSGSLHFEHNGLSYRIYTSDRIIVSEFYSYIPLGAIVSNRIADSAITMDKIADSAITTDKIGDNEITANKISNSAITTDKIADSAVTMDKLSDDVKSAIESGSTDLGAGSGITITEGTINVKESGITESMISGPLMDLIHGHKLSLSLGSGGVVFTGSTLGCTVSYGGGLTNVSNITVESQDAGVYTPTMTNNTGTGTVGSTANYNGYTINANATLYGETQISATTKLYIVDKMYFGFAADPTSVPEVQTPKRTYKGDFTATGSGKCFLIIPTGMWTGEAPTIGTALNAKSNNYGVSLQCVLNSATGKGYLFALGHAEGNTFVYNELEQGTITITIS